MREKIAELVRLSRQELRASIDATHCGTTWDYKKAHEAAEKYEAAQADMDKLCGELSALTGKLARIGVVENDRKDFAAILKQLVEKLG